MSFVPQKKCGKCEKTVYPTEEINCLDKFWHKGCLKCTVCGTTLNLKNVKGYDKIPYCQVHYPQPKPTVVVDNPEMQRIRLLTDLQSESKYREDFNKNKGKFTAVVDDPMVTRAREQQRLASQVEYTGKRKENPTQVNVAEPSAVATLVSNQPTLGRIADYDPINGRRGSLSQGYEPTSHTMHKFEMNTHPEPPSSTGVNRSLKVRALYTYQGTDVDELSFNEGDILIDCEQIDEGWMVAHHPNTGARGLIPSNYVEILD